MEGDEVLFFRNYFSIRFDKLQLRDLCNKAGGITGPFNIPFFEARRHLKSYEILT